MPSSLFYTGAISRNERNDLSQRSQRVSFVHKKIFPKSAMLAPALSAFPFNTLPPHNISIKRNVPGPILQNFCLGWFGC